MQLYSLAKSCDACIQSKKRCDKSLPRCQRCVSKDVECRYQNQPLSQAYTPADESTSRQVSESSTNLAHRVGQESQSGLTSIRLPDFEAVFPYDQESYIFMVSALRTFPITTVEQRGNLFLHPELYRSLHNHIPLQVINQICSDNIHLLKAGQYLSSELLDPALISLEAAAAATTSFSDTLAWVQAMITYQILTAFSPHSSSEGRQAADQRQRSLKQQTHKLWSMAPTELPSSFDPSQAYLLAETVRRTVLIAYVVLELYQIKLTSQHQHNFFMAALPFGATMQLWDNSGKVSQSRDRFVNAPLLSFREYTEKFEAGAVKEPTLFEKILLIGCRGLREFNKRFATMQISGSA